MEQTNSYVRVVPEALLARYELAEVRNAAAALAGTNPDEFLDILYVLDGFRLTLGSLTDAGKNKSDIAIDLDLAFRTRGWREAGHESETRFSLNFSPYPAGDPPLPPIEFEYGTKGHKVDNFRGRVAADVEWNAKDGNLDRDLANFRALHDVSLIDVGVLITRNHARTRWAANYLAEAGNRIRYTRGGQRIVLLGTSTTTNMEQLIPRLERGDAGGCPVLAVALTERCYLPGPTDPDLPAFPGPGVAVVPDPEQDAAVVADQPEADAAP